MLGEPCVHQVLMLAPEWATTVMWALTAYAFLLRRVSLVVRHIF